jgi:hypothetical protein
MGFELQGIADSRFWAYGEMMPADSVATRLIHRAGGELDPAVVTISSERLDSQVRESRGP